MAEVIIIGGGIAGCTTAFYLAKDGVDVLLLEQSELNSSSSGSNAGSLHAQIQQEPFLEMGEEWARSFAPTLPLFAESIQLWCSAGEMLDVDLEVVQGGGILVATSDKEMRLIEAKARIENSAGLQMELLNRSDLLSKAPYISSEMVGGVFCSIEGKANPLIAAPAFAKVAEKEGAKILCGETVTGINKNGTSYEVVTSKNKHHAERIVNAAGIGAGRIASFIGISVEIQAFPIQLSVTEPVESLFPHLIYSARDMLTMKQTQNGTIVIGGGWLARVDERGRPQVSAESLSRNLAVALQVIPSIAHINIVRTWAATVNGTKNWKPILGEIPGQPGFFMNYIPWMGFTGAPAGSYIVANLVQGKTPQVNFDLSYFAP